MASTDKQLPRGPYTLAQASTDDLLPCSAGVAHRACPRPQNCTPMLAPALLHAHPACETLDVAHGLQSQTTHLSLTWYPMLSRSQLKGRMLVRLQMPFVWNRQSSIESWPSRQPIMSWRVGCISCTFSQRSCSCVPMYQVGCAVLSRHTHKHSSGDASCFVGCCACTRLARLSCEAGFKVAQAAACVY